MNDSIPTPTRRVRATMIKRATASIALASVASLAVAACSSGGSSGSTTSGGGKKSSKTTVALVTINETAAFFTQMNKGAQAEAKKLGVSLIINNPDNAVSKQNTAVEDYANQGIKAEIVDSINGPSVYSAIKYAHGKGTHIVAVDSILDSPAVDTQIGVDNEAAGKQLGDYYCTWAKTNLPQGKGKIGVVAALNSPIQIQRQKGFVNTAKACGGSIVQTVDGQNVESTAQTAAQNLVTAQPSMTVVYDTGEPANIGAISALKQAKSKAALFGWDLDPAGIAAIKSGAEVAAIQQNPYQEGVEAVEAAVKLIEGQQAPKNVTAPATVITKRNVGSVTPY
ncbi:substrate-binding domain-containing protein [Flexivirga caeni]|uniref:Sugar ABC transporter substrate-binding protein n=1 Tax=Flexivirga caeni TaxID=2294115 RepID=A0A3M9MFB6_9MICO|nr:substrate-binding domain-containing protein [Flexivirga caeni]RNI24242.1 sugar ABC transporter substrate-binding protein [Flexivirga caeni]